MLEALGLGAKFLTELPSDNHQRMNITALEQAIANDIAAGVKPAYVIGTTGTTNIFCRRVPVSPEVAVRLAKMFDTEVLFWVRMQGAYDAWNAAKSVDVSTIPKFAA